MTRRSWGAHAGAVLGLLAALVTCGGRPAPLPLAQHASPAEVDVSLFLVGDAGKPAHGFEPVLAALRKEVAADAARSVVVYLGDNLYPNGLPDSTHVRYAEYARRLDEQVAVVRETGARAVFVPGNHDWGMGLAGIMRQQRFVEELGDGNVSFLPRPGCPGPHVHDLGHTVRLVALDTQWWFHADSKAGAPQASCSHSTRGDVIDSIRAVLRHAEGRRAIVVAHHPLESGGPHGGHFDWTWHVFPLRKAARWLWIPLPIIGSAYPISRKLGINDQDLTSSVYKTLRDSLRSAFSERPPLIYAAGHEHNLQVIRDASGGYLVVSGAGIFDHANPVSWLDGTQFAASAEGFVRLDVLRSGRARLAVLVVAEDGRAREAFAMWIEREEAPSRP